jgi:hypothetical protein
MGLVNLGCGGEASKVSLLRGKPNFFLFFETE